MDCNIFFRSQDSDKGTTGQTKYDPVQDHAEHADDGWSASWEVQQTPSKQPQRFSTESASPRTSSKKVQIR